MQRPKLEVISVLKFLIRNCYTEMVFFKLGSSSVPFLFYVLKIFRFQLRVFYFKYSLIIQI